jgi:nitrite reductase/ring-hydroxylating ferredoxin subunit
VARWFPVGRGAEVVSRHIAQTQLLGEEIAVWRDDAGGLNAWQNRCPHRGVRLSIGTNTGTELRCQYHGWRFASGSGQCSVIPAHPTQKPASSVRVKTYAVTERYHLVWINPDVGSAAAPSLPIEEPSQDTTLRSVFTNSPLARVFQGLQREYEAVTLDEFTLRAAGLVFSLQPVTDSQTIIHGVAEPGTFGSDRLTALRQHNSKLSVLRDALERGAP